MRVTKKDVHGMFKRLCNNLKPKIAKELSLDYASEYGGFKVVSPTELGEWYPFGHTRRNTREMYLSLYLACEALELNK